jgi:cytochrome b involved in lipid metabolism
MAQDGETDSSSSMTMPPPPKIAASTSSASASSDRKMNDTTMPPPRYSAGAKQSSPSGMTKSSATPRTGGGPRFGLHDWKRLLASSKDLAQLKGASLRRNIPLEEIRLHNKNHDGWIILRGNVYNIGPYLPYHPGGIEIFKNVLGKDASSMFDKYHRWVNIDGLIGPLMIGTAASAGTKNSNQFSVVPPKESHLTNAPRVSIQQAASSSALWPNLNENEEDDEEEEEYALPPAPT